MSKTLRIVPVSQREAFAFVAEHHRHLPAPRGDRFRVGLAQHDELVGVAIVGRPVARSYDDGLTVEVNRVAVAADIPNGCSMLYGAAWRAARALGYRRLITYTRTDERGTSQRAAGLHVLAERTARPAGWSVPSRRRRSPADGGVARTLWEVTA